MNKKELSTYLHKPQLLDRHAEIALQEVITDFPYFQAAHQLLLKAYQNKDSYHIDRQLPVASLLHGDRTILFDYLKEKLLNEFQETVINDFSTATEVLLPQEPETTAQAEGTDEPASEPQAIQTEIIEPEPLPESIDAYEAVEPDLPFQNFEEKYLSKHEVTDEPKEEVIHTTTDTKVEVVDETYKQPETLPELEPVSQPVSETLVPEVEVPETVTPELPVAEISKTEPETPAPRPEEQATEKVESNPHDFLSWLQQVKAKAHHTPKPVEKEEAPVVQQTFETKEEAENRIQKEEADKKLKKFNALIDKFIETNPSISKPQPTRFYNAAEKAKESLVENFDMVTETLAKIYIKQSNYRKAIMVYEKLSLIYPEKISYFATQIQNLKELLNNK